MKLTVISTAYFNLLHAIFKQQKYLTDKGIRGYRYNTYILSTAAYISSEKEHSLVLLHEWSTRSDVGQCVNWCHMCWECQVRFRSNTIQQIRVCKINSMDVGIRVVRTFLFCFSFLFHRLCHGYVLLYQFVSS